MTFFKPSRDRVRCPDGIGSRPRTAASWTRDRDWIVPAEPTQVLNPVLRNGADGFLDGLPVLFTRGIAADELGQPHRAQRQALGQEDPLAVGDDELRRAAADVDQKERVEARGEFAARRQVDQARLLLAGNDVHLDARAAAHGVEEFLGVLRLPHRAGGDGPDELRLLGGDRTLELLDHGDPGLDRLGRQAPRREGFAPEPHRGLLPRQHLENAALVHGGHEQLDAVGADVDGGELFHSGGIFRPPSRDRLKSA